MNSYSSIKSIITSIIPRTTLFRYEYFFRYFLYLKFRGKKFQCNICAKSLNSFISFNEDKMCPRCGSLKRTRRLWNILETEFIDTNKKILDFSPSRSIYRNFKKGNYLYTSSDLSGDFISEESFDITNINKADYSFDIIICYHILEHIEDDMTAMKELYRVLAKNGHCLVQTPFKDGEIYEDSSLTTNEQREKSFGQSDHVRVYSIDGLKDRLEKVGFQVSLKKHTEHNNNTNGFSENETILICKK